MESYDEVPYPGAPFAQTHPDRLATHALLFGLEPAPPQRCRVLELGCGDGENLVPMALGAPERELVGIDLAARAVEQGRALARALGFANVTLHAADLRDVSADWGRFDYVIAHGVWSWVPDAVRERMLEICREHLAPNGVAYVSYDVLPGGHLRRMMREMMLYHARHAVGDRARIAAARELLALLAPADGPSSAYHAVLRAEAATLSRRSDGALFHDDLCDDHALVHFHEFAARARSFGLQYLAEAELIAMNEGRLAPALRQGLQGVAPTRVEREQYIDFAQGRRFRQTLLCRAEAPIADAPRPEAVLRLFASARVACDADASALLSSQPVRFGVGTDGGVEIWHPVAKLALAELGAVWPATLATPELLERVRVRRGKCEDADASVVCESLLALYAAARLVLRATPAPFGVAIDGRPRASGLARLQVRRGPHVTTLDHQRVQIDDALSAALLGLLDGTRDHEAIVADLAQMIRAGGAPAPEGTSASDPRLADALRASLRENLAGLAQLALLEP